MDLFLKTFCFSPEKLSQFKLIGAERTIVFIKSLKIDYSASNGGCLDFF